MGRSTQVWEHPPLFFVHSFTPQSSVLSSSQPMQSGFLLHTFSKGMHEPSLHSNWIRGSQLAILLVQFFSSLPSAQSVLPLQYKWPKHAYYWKLIDFVFNLFNNNTDRKHFNIQIWSFWSQIPEMHERRSSHWNWSDLQVTFWHLCGDSSAPFGQSFSPSHTQVWWIQVTPSSQSNSLLQWLNFVLFETFYKKATYKKLCIVIKN